MVLHQWLFLLVLLLILCAVNAQMYRSCESMYRSCESMYRSCESLLAPDSVECFNTGNRNVVFGGNNIIRTMEYDKPRLTFTSIVIIATICEQRAIGPANGNESSIEYLQNKYAPKENSRWFKGSFAEYIRDKTYGVMSFPAGANRVVEGTDLQLDNVGSSNCATEGNCQFCSCSFHQIKTAVENWKSSSGNDHKQNMKKFRRAFTVICIPDTKFAEQKTQDAVAREINELRSAITKTKEMESRLRALEDGGTGVCTWGGIAEVGGSTLILNNNLNDKPLIFHEIGHNLGLGHSNRQLIDSGAEASREQVTHYGDNTCVMGGETDVNTMLNAAQSAYLGISSPLFGGLIILKKVATSSKVYTNDYYLPPITRTFRNHVRIISNETDINSYFVSYANNSKENTMGICVHKKQMQAGTESLLIQFLTTATRAPYIFYIHSESDGNKYRITLTRISSQDAQLSEKRTNNIVNLPGGVYIRIQIVLI
jgi:hypothetical protein